jgi:hypothetical protein
VNNWSVCNVFEVLTAVVMKSSIFWDIMSCSTLKVNRHFGGTCHLHLQGQRISQAKKQCESRWQAKKPACRNFELYRKQEGNGRQQVSSCWLACMIEWTARTHWLSETTEQTNRRQEQNNQPVPESWLLCLPPAFTLISCLVYSLTMMVEATCFSEMSVDFQWTTWCYIP